MLIKHGEIYTKNGFKKLDILIKDGVINKIAKNINEVESEKEEVILANGKYIFPGAIDVHTHLDLDVGFAKANDDFYTGTVAAACGGTTTIVDHVGFGPDGCDLDYQIKHYHKLAKDKAVIDYGFHGVIQHVDDNVLDKMEKMLEEGVTSYKVYMTYSGRLSDDKIFNVLKRAKELDVLIAVHAENNDIVEHLKKEFIDNRLTSFKYHPKSRPEECEAEAINRILSIGKIIGDAPIYIVHVSNGLSLEYIDFFRRRGYKKLYAETCPQYLYLDDSYYEREDGLKFILSPPLRDKSNKEILWQGLRLGEIDTVATDHCPFAYNKDKQKGKDDFTKCPNGMPGIETRYPLMISAALSGTISFQTLIDTCCKNPAKLFGLYPKKGEICVGADADLVIFNPKVKSKIKHEKLHENIDYTPYEDIKIKGEIKAVLSRGTLIVKDGDFIGKKGRGEFIKRDKFQDV
jgi:dihydropyrimidinase